jgi:DNA-binding transcriptional regulator YiaG
MTVNEICEKYGYTQTQLSRRFGIPWRTVQNWYSGVRQPPDYVLNMIVEILEHKKNGG